MPQSIYQDDQYKIFNKYTKKLMREIDTYSLEKREQSISNWLKGRNQMEQLALKYKMELNTPYPLFARRDEINNIKWIKATVGGEEIIFGIWKGEDHIKLPYEGENRHVFNDGYLDFLTHGSKNKTKAKNIMAKTIASFDGKEIK